MGEADPMGGFGGFRGFFQLLNARAHARFSHWLKITPKTPETPNSPTSTGSSLFDEKEGFRLCCALAATAH